MKFLENFPTVLIIFGATGDLMERKLLPAIFHLYRTGSLPKMFQVVSFAKENLSQEEYKSWLRKNLPKTSKVNTFLDKFFYQPGLFEDINSYFSIGKKLGQVDGVFRTCANKLFYLAVPPNYYEVIFRNLAKSGLTKPCSPKEGWTRVLVEKPFGQDLKLARKLDSLLGKLFREIQVFRIDHYLAKETIQSLLTFRFSNALFEAIWNKNFIEKIEIRLLEKEGVEKRGFLYDSLGALRDVGQNHLLQMLALICMDAPKDLKPDSIRLKKIEILKFLPRMRRKAIEKLTIRGQYKGYLGIPGAKENSQTETYFKIKTFLNHLNWQGIPLYLESGKSLKRDLAEIEITFSAQKLCPFFELSKDVDCKNTLCFQIRPKEGIKFCFFAKKPGRGMVVERKDLHFSSREAFKKEKPLPDYERLLIDAFMGDQTLFLSTKEILTTWEFIDPILRGWQKDYSPLRIYKPGTAGPTQAAF